MDRQGNTSKPMERNYNLKCCGSCLFCMFSPETKKYFCLKTNREATDFNDLTKCKYWVSLKN